MKYEVYCDESNPDAFTSQSDTRAQYCVIGSLWLPADQRIQIKQSINALKQKYDFKPEIKWHKVHARYETFYHALTDLYLELSKQDQIRFRAIAVEAEKVNLVRFHENDAELGFYKFYYQMLVHWILDFNEYRVYCDEKTNRIKNRLATLRLVLDRTNISSSVLSVQALPSHEVVLIQFCDFLLGMASARLNESVVKDCVKDRVIRRLEEGLEVNRLAPTSKDYTRFNIFKINLAGGW